MKSNVLSIEDFKEQRFEKDLVKSFERFALKMSPLGCHLSTLLDNFIKKHLEDNFYFKARSESDLRKIIIRNIFLD